MVVVSLFDYSGNMVRPWAEAGHTCFCFDLVNGYEFEKVGSGEIHYFYADLRVEEYIQRIIDLKPDFIFAFPPCTDLATCGAKHFENKRNADPLFQEKAMELVYVVKRIAKECGVPYFFENPSSRIATLHRKPDFIFHPWEYGGYLDVDDSHPRYPFYFPPQDAYMKRTCLWYGNGFLPPAKRPVAVRKLVNNGAKTSSLHMKLGGDREKTKMIRSETPRGFAQAVFLMNEKVY